MGGGRRGRRERKKRREEQGRGSRRGTEENEDRNICMKERSNIHSSFSESLTLFTTLTELSTKMACCNGEESI